MPKFVPSAQAKKPLVRNPLILAQIGPLVRYIANKFLLFENRKETMQTKRQKGFTLIELMITLVVLVIALSIAVPNFAAWIKNNRIDAATRTLAGTLNLARSEAVSRQTVITVNSGGNWSNGLTIYTDTTPTGNTAQVAGDTLIKDLDFSMDGITVNTNDGDNFISFTSSGLLNEGGNQLSIAICDDRGVSQGTLITINAVGRTSIGNPTTCTPP